MGLGSMRIEAEDGVRAARRAAAARGAAGAAGARRRAAQHERRRAAKLRRIFSRQPIAAAHARGRCAPARAPSTSRARRCRPSTPSTPSAKRKPVTAVDDPRIEAALRRLEVPRAEGLDAEERPPAMGLDGFEPPAPDERLRFSEADRPDAYRRPDAEERPPAMGLEGFEPPAKDSLVGPDTLERSATLAELMMSTPGKRCARRRGGIDKFEDGSSTRIH